MVDCNKVKKESQELGELEQLQRRVAKDKFDKEQPQPHYLKGEEGNKFTQWIDNYLITKYGREPGRPWTSKEWRNGVKAAFNSDESGGKSLKQKYPNMNIDSAILASEIIALVQDKIWLQDIVDTIYWELLPEYRPVISSNKGGEIDLATLPLTVLKPIYQEIRYVVSATETGGTTEGAIGYMRLKLNLPKTYAKNIGSEGYYDLADGLSRYNETISSMVKDFTTAPKNLIVDGKKSKRTYGYQDILNILNDMTEEVDTTTLYSGEIQEAMVSLFTRLNLGWMYIDEQGNLMINTEYKGTGKTYASTGDSIKALMNPVKIEDYNFENADLSEDVRSKIKIDKLGFLIGKMWSSLNSKKKNYLINGRNNKPGLTKLTEMFRDIDNEVLVYFDKETNKSINELLLGLSSLFKGVLNNSQIRKIFFEKDYKQLDEYKSLDKANRETVDLLYNTFSKSSLINLAQLNATPIIQNPNFKKNHFPISYFNENLGDLYEKYLFEVTNRLEAIEEEIEGLTGDDRKNLLSEKRNLKYGLLAVSKIKENMLNDGYDQDTTADQTLPIARDNVYIKHVTGAFDIRNMRQDAGAYGKNLRDRASIIQRNRLALKLIQSLQKEKRPEVRANMINMYKGLFGRPDTVGGIFFWEGSAESYSNMLGGLISPKWVHRLMQLGNSAVSGRYLSGIGTALQNWSAIAHAIHARGIYAYTDAVKALENHKDAIYEMVDASGIIDFSDYYSAQLVNDLAGVQIETQTQNIIIGAMINYHGRLSIDNSAKGKEAAEQEFRANIQKALEESRTFMDSIIIPDYETVVERQRDNRYARVRNVINRYVDWAITKNFEYSKIYNTDLLPRFERVAYSGLSTLASIYSSLFTIGPLQGMTMAETEKGIRVISFVIGLQAAMKPGGPLEKTSFNNLTGEQFDLAVEIGRKVSREINYGMTSQDVGQIAQGDVGNSTTKFKIWYMQNMSKDLKRFKRFFQSLKSLEAIDDNRIDWKVIGRILPTLFTNQRKLRSTNPAAAQFKSFIVGSGLFTAAATALVIAPMGLVQWAAFNKIMRTILGDDLRKYMGSLYSDLLAIAVIMPTFLTASFILGMDDEEEFDIVRYLQFMSRKTFLGWGPTYALDIPINFIRMLLDEGFGPAQYTGKVISPVLGAPEIEQLIQELMLKPVDKSLAE